MARLLLCFITWVLVLFKANAQMVEIKGTIRCLNKSHSSTKGMENVVIVPDFSPSRSVITGSQPPGYFELKTGIPFYKLADKQVNIYLLSRCSQCAPSVQRVFVNKSSIILANWKLDSFCSAIELSPKLADSLLIVSRRKEPINLDKVSAGTAAIPSGGLFNLLTTVVRVASNLPATGKFPVTRLFEGEINYGQLIFGAAMYNTGSQGFNFAGGRDMSEAIFTNPASIRQDAQPNNVSLFTNFRNNGKLGGYFRLSDRVSLGGGVLFAAQDEFRRVAVFSDYSLQTDSFPMKLTEYAFVLASSFKLSEKLNAGLSVKSINQNFSNPDSIDIRLGDDTDSFFSTTVRRNNFELDFSLSYAVSSSLQLGVNAMNLLGSRLYADAFLPGQDSIQYYKQRGVGVGVNYKWMRFNFGTDILLNEEGLYDFSLGANYVPFNNALISGGFAFRQKSYSIGFRMKYFKLMYINNNDFLVSEKRNPRINLFNGRLHSGFVLDF